MKPNRPKQGQILLAMQEEIRYQSTLLIAMHKQMGMLVELVASLCPQAASVQRYALPVLDALTYEDTKQTMQVKRQRSEKNIDMDVSIKQLVERKGDQLDKANKRAKILKDILKFRPGRDRGERIRYWADRLKITPQGIRKWLRRYEASGKKVTSLFRKNRDDKGKRKSTCKAVQDRIKVLYLDIRKPSVREVYRQVIAEVQDRKGPEVCNECCYRKNCPDTEWNGWKIGSERIAYSVIKEL